MSDLDVGYHIRTGAYILEHHRIPTTNTFSYTTPEQEWPIHQWWPTILYNRAYYLGGVAGLISFKACIAALLMLVVWASARQVLGRTSLWPFWLATAGVMIARVRFFERPDLISALIFALVVFLDLRFNNRWRWQWIGLPLLMAMWANTHAGVMYGFVFLCAVAAGDWIETIWQRRKAAGIGREPGTNTWKPLLVRPLGIAIALIASVLTLEMITPSGYRVLLAPITQFMSPFWQGMIAEYQPPTWAGSKLFYLSLVALVVLQTLTWRHLRLRLLFSAAAFGYLACSSSRSVLAYCILAVPYAAFLIGHVPNIPSMWRLKRLQPLLVPVAWAGILLLVVIPHKTFRFGVGYHAPYYPLEIYSFIEKEVPPQNIFHNMRYGGGMLWWLYPRFKPFLDGRGDAYTPEFWQREYLPILYAEAGWREKLRKHDAHAVWLPIARTGQVSKLAELLFEDPQWALVIYNDDSLLFLERTELNQEIISQNEFRCIWPGDASFSKVNAGTLEVATQEAYRALSRSPNSFFARAAAARTSMSSGEYAKAVVLYTALVDAVKDQPFYWRDYGYCLYMAGKLEEADRVFERMLRKHWLPGYAHYMRHFIALEMKKWAESDEYLAKAIETEPTNEEYQQAQSKLRAELKRAVTR